MKRKEPARFDTRIVTGNSANAATAEAGRVPDASDGRPLLGPHDRIAAGRLVRIEPACTRLSAALISPETRSSWSGSNCSDGYRTSRIYSLISLWACHRLTSISKPDAAAWYRKTSLTFSDAIGAVRLQFWVGDINSDPPPDPRTAENSSVSLRPHGERSVLRDAIVQSRAEHRTGVAGALSVAEADPTLRDDHSDGQENDPIIMHMAIAFRSSDGGAGEEIRQMSEVYCQFSDTVRARLIGVSLQLDCRACLRLPSSGCNRPASMTACGVQRCQRFGNTARSIPSSTQAFKK